eukprot:scaffold43477_cov45-Phaeocystis_antarctica.AAC.1
MGMHPPELPPHRTTQRWLPSEQVTITFDFQPSAIHWKQIVAPAFVPSVLHAAEQVLEHGVSFALEITYGVPRRSMTPCPVYEAALRLLCAPRQSYAEPATWPCVGGVIGVRDVDLQQALIEPCELRPLEHKGRRR